jgi:hypothetical protein
VNETKSLTGTINHNCRDLGDGARSGVKVDSLDEKAIIATLAGELSALRSNIQRVRNEVSFVAIREEASSAFCRTDHRCLIAVQEFLDLNLKNSQAAAYALRVSGTDALNMFPEIAGTAHQRLSSFWNACQAEILRLYSEFLSEVGRAEAARIHRKQICPGRPPRSGRKKQIRWMQYAGMLQCLLVKKAITRKELAACLDRLRFNLDDVFPKSRTARISRSSYENIDLDARPPGRLKSFGDAVRLEEGLTAARRRNTLPAGLPRQTPWRFIQKRLWRTKEDARSRALLCDVSLERLLELCPDLTGVIRR